MMERRARAARPRLTWLPAAAGALLLVLVGFAVGLVAGAAFEEPDLVLAQIGGRTTGVPLPLDEAGEALPAELAELAEPAEPAEPGSDAQAEALPEVSAAAVTGPATASGPGAAPTPRAAGAAAEAAPSAKVPAVPAPAGDYAVQVGAFAEPETAERLAERLRAIELPAYVLDVGALEKARFRVRVGPFANEAQAQQLSARLRADHQLPTWVIGGDGR